MGEALKIEQVRVEGRKVRLEVDTPDLPDGTCLNVTLEVVSPSDQGDLSPESFLSMRGKAKGGFATAEEVDAFIRKERNAWE